MTLFLETALTEASLVAVPPGYSYVQRMGGVALILTFAYPNKLVFGLKAVSKEAQSSFLFISNSQLRLLQLNPIESDTRLQLQLPTLFDYDPRL